jgi:hypothetical protein
MRRPYREPENELRSARRSRPNLFAWVVRAAMRGRLAVILVWAVLASAGITYSLVKTSLDMSGTGLIALEPKTVEAEQTVEQAFPGITAPIVAVIDSSDPEAARQAATDLSRAMRAEPGSFSDVFAPGTGEFFEEYGVLYLDAQAVAELVRRIERTAPLYRAIAASPDLAGLAQLAAQAARAITEGRSPQGLSALFREAAVSVKGQIDNQRHDLDWPSLLDHVAPPASTRWYVTAAPAAAAGGFEEAVRRAQSLAGETSSTAKGAVSITITGQPALNTAGEVNLAPSLLWPALIAGILVMIVLGFGLARPSLILALLLTLALGFGVFLGGLALIAPALDRVTAAAPVLYLGPALMALIAGVLRSEECERNGLATEAGVMLAAHRLGPALLAIAIAIPGGALGAHLSSFTSLAKLALIAAMAAAAIFAAALTLLPALLAFISTPEGDTHLLDDALDGPTPPLWRKLRQALIAMLLVAAVLFAALLPQVGIEVGGPGRTAEPPAALSAAAQLLAKPGEDARTLAVRLSALPEVASVRWIESFLPPDEAEKRRILADLDGVLPSLPEQSNETEERLRPELNRLEQHLLDIANDPRTAGDLKSAASEFRRSLALLDGPRLASPDAMRRLENSLFARLPLLFERAQRLANLPALSSTTLDPDIIHHFVAADGAWRIEVMPRNPAALGSFAGAVRAVAPNAAIPAIAELQLPALMRAGVGYMIAGILVLSLLGALVVTRSVLATIRVIIPPLLVMMIAAGSLAIASRSFPAEAIALIVASLAMAIGAGLIGERWNGYRWARSQETPSALPRAVLLAELAFAAAFAPLTLASLESLRAFGWSAFIAVCLQFVASFVIAPELRAMMRRRS